jgi:hypothetical protein
LFNDLRDIMEDKDKSTRKQREREDRDFCKLWRANVSEELRETYFFFYLG